LGIDTKKIPSVLIDKPVPQFDLPPLYADRAGLKTDDLKGQITLVNIFASWCVPCRIEHPLLMQLAAEKRLPIFGINYKDRPEDAKRWLSDLGDPYSRIGADNDGRVSIDWGVYGVPESFLVDGTGTILYKQVGPLTADVIQDTILPLVEARSQ